MQAGLQGKAVKETGALPLLAAVINILRPRQWTKNLLLFAGLVFSENLFTLPLLWRTVLAFAVFCLLSGAAYIINDITDIAEDRKHYKKRTRPLASGRLSKRQALIAFSLLLAVSLSTALYLGAPFLLTALLYFLLALSYSLYFKHIVIADVFTIALGFLLRAVAGAVVIGVRISPWLFICTLLLALFLALTKRRHEFVTLEHNGTEHRRVLADYSVAYLDQLISIVTAATIMAYSLYTFTATAGRPEHPYLMLSIPLVLYGLFRYLFLVHKKEMGGSPEDVLLQDKPLIAVIVLWVVLCVAVLHLDS